MNLTIPLTDDDKRAIRYLNKSPAQVQTEMLRQCTDVLKNYIHQAKIKWIETKKMVDIDPDPI